MNKSLTVSKTMPDAPPPDWDTIDYDETLIKRRTELEMIFKKVVETDIDLNVNFTIDDLEIRMVRRRKTNNYLTYYVNKFTKWLLE